jgi:hypothetical protein
MSALKHSENQQLTLPLEVLEADLSPEYAAIVKQNWKITFSRQYLSSVHAKRVMGVIASQIQETGEVQEYYQITADKIISEVNLDKFEVYKRMKGLVYELANIVYFIEDDETQTVIPRHLLDTTRFKYPAGYSNGTLTVAFNPQLKGIVNHLAHYSRYELNAYVNFGSWYSMRLYELLAAFKDKPFVEFDIDKYREWMGCGVELDRQGNPRMNKKTGKPRYMKYASHTNAIERTTREPLKEMAGTEMAFRVSPVFSTAAGRGRPAIVRVRFDFLWQEMSVSEKIVTWCEKSEDFKRIYERLRAYKVTDAVIAKYAKTIGKKELNQLLYQWDVRQEAHSKDKIANLERYCNKVVKDTAERILSEQKNG